jgi:SET domain
VAPSRTVDWIRKHGMCIDNIRIDTATDPTMGRGAFATRAMKAGTRVAPAPIQVFADRTVFAQQVPEAQFINYCFAIGEKMLLYPYGPGVNLINHAPAEKANVRVEWSRHAMHHGTWLDLPLSQFLQMDYPGGLIMDVIAMRDIAEGEELFMDYGPAWEQAWETHLDTWKPSDLSYVYPQDVDTKTQPFRTLEEQKKDPYADNLATVCWTNNWEREKGKKMKWTRPTKFDWPEGVAFCHILSRTSEKGEYVYEVAMHFDWSDPGSSDNRDFIDTNMPHSAIALVDKPYRSDLHLPNAFRQPLELPADMIPAQWLDAVTATQTVPK